MKPVLVFAFLVLLSCQEKTSEPLSLTGTTEVCPNGNTATQVAEGYQLLPGTWNWVQDVWSRRGSGTTIDTPNSTGKQFRFVFSADRTYQYLENGTVTETGTYALRQAGNDPILVLDLVPSSRNGSGGVLFTLCENGLVLLGGANDAGANRYFVRGK